MNRLIDVLIRMYGFLLRMYPAAFRSEFQEQMFLDFTDMAVDARKKGKLSFFFFYLRELVDFPINLLQVHWKEDRLFKLLRSRPISTSIGAAFGFGLASFLSVLVNEIVFEKLFFAEDSILDYLQLYYFDLFHTTNGQPVVYWIPGAISSLFVGLILGVVFAVFVADRSEYPHFIFAVALSWYLRSAVASMLLHSANLPFFLSSRHSMYLDVASTVLSSAFLALMFVVVKSKTGRLLRFLVIGAVGYPLFAFIYVRLLLKFLIIETPWMFIALMALMVMYIGSVIVIVLKNAGGRGAVAMIVLGVLVFQFVPYLLRYISMQWLSFPEMPSTLYYDDPIYWQLKFKIAIQSGIYGVPLGLILGFLFEVLNVRSTKQLVTGT